MDTYIQKHFAGALAYKWVFLPLAATVFLQLRVNSWSILQIDDLKKNTKKNDNETLQEMEIKFHWAEKVWLIYKIL